ncbi:hypothetical protein EYF80_018021 [Liparis tanakae]|uniref:Uncharacterized protein n=1 Tax=Liparis tanakae TaxID=230148 RepID=A0A4Z2I1H2_9TELE|nr:hypothetical protein EYF80_018021 [Liparis tanakae]
MGIRGQQCRSICTVSPLPIGPSRHINDLTVARRKNRNPELTHSPRDDNATRRTCSVAHLSPTPSNTRINSWAVVGQELRRRGHRQESRSLDARDESAPAITVNHKAETRQRSNKIQGCGGGETERIGLEEKKEEVRVLDFKPKMLL